MLAFDAPAHGKSKGKTINASLYSKMILQIEKEVDVLFAIVAHSLGGLAASLSFEVMRDEKKKLVLIAPATETSTAITTFFNFLQLDPAIRKDFEQCIINGSGESSDWYSIKRAMKNIRAKVLWVHDKEDDITPVSDVIKVQEENYPGIEFVFTSGLGHRRIYRDNKVTNLIVDFL